MSIGKIEMKDEPGVGELPGVTGQGCRAAGAISLIGPGAGAWGGLQGTPGSTGGPGPPGFLVIALIMRCYQSD